MATKRKTAHPSRTKKPARKSKPRAKKRKPAVKKLTPAQFRQPFYRDFDGAVLMEAIKVRAKRNLAKNTFIGTFGEVVFSAVQAKKSTRWVEHFVWVTFKPRIDAAEMAPSRDYSSLQDPRTRLLHEALEDVSRAAPWRSQIARTVIRRGIRFHGSLRMTGIAMLPPKHQSWDFLRVKIGGKKSYQADVNQSYFVNVTLAVLSWDDFLAIQQGKIGSTGRLVRVRLHVLQPTRGNMRDMRTGLSDKQWSRITGRKP